MTAASLAKVVERGLCTGCGACVSAVARPEFGMEMAGAGYLRPRTEVLSPQESKAAVQVCAGAALEGLEGDGTYHPLWGPVAEVLTGHACDAEVRYRGSSGGVLTALAIGLVEAGEVEFVLSTSADPADPIGNTTLPRAERTDILAAAGSRYAPSSPLEKVYQHLDAGRRFAFVGKPCDVAGLNRLAKRDPRIDALIPYRFAFFCAGVPSRTGTLAVLEKLGVTYEDCVRFQYRGNGWPGLAKAERRDGSDESMDYNSSWGHILNRHLQFRCKMCPDGTGEFADVACADAWYGKDGYPDFAERDGRSLIVVRTEKGRRLIETAIAKGWIAADPLDIAEIEKMQPYQAARKRNLLARSTGLLMAKGYAPRFRRFALVRLALAEAKVGQLRNAFGTFRRALGNRQQ